MANAKITDLTAEDPVDDADVIAVVDVSAGETKKVTRAAFGGLRFVTPTGTVNGVNRDFSTPIAPKAYVVQGIWCFQSQSPGAGDRTYSLLGLVATFNFDIFDDDNFKAVI